MTRSALSLLLASALLVAACSSDDDDEVGDPITNDGVNSPADDAGDPVAPRDLPIYDSVPATARAFSDWLRTGAPGTVGEDNDGGWTCYANTASTEVGWSGLYFNSADDGVDGIAAPSDPASNFLVELPTGYRLREDLTIEFDNGVIWTDIRFVVAEGTFPIFSGDDSRGFNVNCTRTNGVPEYA